MVDANPCLGRWVALLRGRVVSVGESAEQARHLAQRQRPSEEPELLFVTPEVQIALTIKRYPLIRRVFNMARAWGVPIYLVGGTVRDLLLGRDTHDLDFAVQGDGLALARHVADGLGGWYVALDRERKTGRVLLTSAHRAAPQALPATLYLDFASLRGDDLAADLRGRDFTINAMAVAPIPDGHWQVHDPLGGCADLMRRVLRMASPSSFADDPVRTLRAVRMQIQFGCAMEPQTRKSLQAAVPRLDQVSAERVRDEWFKILHQGDAADALQELHRLGLLRAIAPPVARLDGVPQSVPREVDALLHSFDTVRAVEQLWTAFQSGEPSPQLPIPNSLRAIAPQIRQRYEAAICDERTYLALLKCGALLHNVSGPEMHTAPPDGRSECRKAGAEIAAQLGQRWRCSNREIELLRTVVRAYMCPRQLADQPNLTRRAIYCYFRDTGEYGLDAALVSLADYVAAWGPGVPIEGWHRQAQTVAQLLTAYFRHRETVVEPALLLSGNDLLSLGLPPGPRIGQLLDRLREEQAAGEIGAREQAIAYAQRWIASHGWLEERTPC